MTEYGLVKYVFTCPFSSLYDEPQSRLKDSGGDPSREQSERGSGTNKSQCEVTKTSVQVTQPLPALLVILHNGDHDICISEDFWRIQWCLSC